jgi:hypothetical protein
MNYEEDSFPKCPSCDTELRLVADYSETRWGSASFIIIERRLKSDTHTEAEKSRENYKKKSFRLQCEDMNETDSDDTAYERYKCSECDYDFSKEDLKNMRIEEVY